MIWVHRTDPDNCGDSMSCPLNYVQDSNHQPVEIRRGDIAEICRDETVILGGGGLLSPYFEPYVRQVLDAARMVIGWGIGSGWPAQKRLHGDVRGADAWGDHLARRFRVLGSRDARGGTWVPCASCLAPFFREAHRKMISEESVVYCHRRMPFAIEGMPAMVNSASFAEAAAFLARGRRVITNSYHGAYWGLLLGREVVAIPWCVKFLTLHEALTLLSHGELLERVPRMAEPKLDADRKFYKACVHANVRFHERLSVEFDVPPLTHRFEFPS